VLGKKFITKDEDFRVNKSPELSWFKSLLFDFIHVNYTLNL